MNYRMIVVKYPVIVVIGETIVVNQVKGKELVRDCSKLSRDCRKLAGTCEGMECHAVNRAIEL
ncbi:hypothetical protein [uncultured Psychrobacillus sp.]|uniref:hypothetical protein n=1 Tax=uncultured Psychrobacillus sp. TaxID=1551585 RepID=UPI0026120CD2|nr:hypothetical protein [uncultured Psychrobacillus sp.]